MTPSAIEPATFRFVAQHLNHCATAVPALTFKRPPMSHVLIIFKDILSLVVFNDIHLLRLKSVGDDE